MKPLARNLRLITEGLLYGFTFALGYFAAIMLFGAPLVLGRRHAVSRTTTRPSQAGFFCAQR